MGVTSEAMINNHQNYKDLVNSLNSSLYSRFEFVGTTKPNEPFMGQVVLNEDDNRLYCYMGSDWECISEDSNEETVIPKKITKTRCDCCGAPLPLKDVDRNGLCECTYCSSISYIWE